MRWGPGPVFLYECLANSRRWQTYAIRSVGVAILLAAIATIAHSRWSIETVNSWREYAELGESYFYAIIGVELTLVLLVAPAATAGALCVDRARGTLSHMLMTDLSDPEIVLGKLAARLLPILGLIACTWPVLAISSLLGGIDPTALTLAFAIILAVALVGCTMAMALSVWGRKPHEIVLVAYTFGMFVLFLWPAWYMLSMTKWAVVPPHWSAVVNPYYMAFARYARPNLVGFWDYLGFFAGALGLSAMFTIVAVWRMRPVACRGAVIRRDDLSLGRAARIRRWLPGPSLDGNPVIWREWHRVRPSRWLMVLVATIGGTTGIACVAGVVLIWAGGMDDFRSQPGFIMGVFGFIAQLTFGLVVLAATAPTSMAEERQRGSLDLLATTTLSTREIVLGKWLGTLRLVLLLAMGPGLVALALATGYRSPAAQVRMGGAVGASDVLSRGELLFGVFLLVATILVHGALIVSVGLALAVWIKHQSRAIAGCVAIAVLIGAGWPIFLVAVRMGPAASDGMALLSPVVVAIQLVETLASRFGPDRRIFWWIASWDIECLTLALGLLWLTVRTFDGCFGRIPDRLRRASVLADIIVVLAALIGVGGLFGAIALESLGVYRVNPGLAWGTLGCALLIGVGLLLIAVRVPSSPWTVGTPGALGLETREVTHDRRLFMRRWWESFRLVLLLAIGPALIGLALATAYRPLNVVADQKTLPDGTRQVIHTDSFTGITYVVTYPRNGAGRVRTATPEEIAARPAEPVRSTAGLLTLALLAVLAVLAHGALFVSLGLAMGIGLRRRGPAIAASAAFFLLVTVAWPLLYVYLYVRLGYPPGPRGLALATPVPAIVVLLLDFLPHEEMMTEFLWWATVWDLCALVLAVAVCSLTIWSLDRRVRINSSREGIIESGSHSRVPATVSGGRPAG